jgi:hypothetical protein
MADIGMIVAKAKRVSGKHRFIREPPFWLQISSFYDY